MKKIITIDTNRNQFELVPIVLDRLGHISHVENPDKVKFELLALKGIEAYIGRGFDFGKIPTEPKDLAYDLLTDEFIESDIFYLRFPKQQAGDYTLKLIFSTGEFYEINIKFNEFDSLEQNNFSLNLWQYPYTSARYYNLEPFSKEHQKVVENHLRCYYESGGRTLTTTIVHDPWNHQTFDPYPSMVKWTHLGNNKFSFNYDEFDQYIRIAKRIGEFDEIYCFSLLPWDNRIFYFENEKFIEEKLTVGSKRWTSIWSQFLISFKNHVEKQGIFEKVLIAVDEREESEMLHAIKLIKEYEPSFRIHAALNYSSTNPEIIDSVDDLSIDMAQLDENIHEVIESRKAKGLKTTMYTCAGDYPNSHAFSHPLETDWTIFYAFALGFDGYMRWALDAWVENPLIDLSHWYWESGDPFLIYPSQDKQVQKSIRYLHLENAIQKVRLLDEVDRAYLAKSLTMPQHRIDAYNVKVALDEKEQDNTINDVKNTYKYIHSKYFKMV